MRKILIVLLLAIATASKLKGASASLVDVTNIVNGVSGGLVGNIVYADAIKGNDATAARGNAGRPFLSISNAVAALQNGDTLVVRPGDYLAPALGSPSSTIGLSNGAAINLVNRTNISIIGVGKPRIISTNTISVMEIENVDQFLMTGLRFECTNKYGGSSISNLVAAVNIAGTSRNFKFEDCEVLNQPDHGIACDLNGGAFNQTNVQISRCIFNNVGSTSGVPSLTADGAAIPCGSFWWIEDCQFTRCFRGVEVFRGATAVVNFEQIRVTGCHFNMMHGESILFLPNLGNDLVKDCEIHGNIFGDNSGELSSSLSCIGGGGGVSRINIGPNVFDFGASTFRYSYAINFNSGAGQGFIQGCQWNGNTIFSSGNTAIYLGDNGSSAVATNNVIENNHIHRPVGGGILIQGAGNSVLNNTIEAVFSANGSIYLVNAGGKTRDNQVIGNIIRTSPTAGIFLDLGASNNIVRDNIIARSTTQSISDLNPLGFNTIEVNLLNGSERRGTNELGPIGNGYPYLTQWSPVTVTNVTTTTNALIALANSDGSLTFGPGFWARNKTVVINQNGTYWSTATPGNNRLFVNLDTSAAASNTVTQTLFAVPASQSGSAYSLEVRLTCMTNTTTGAILAEGTLTTMNGSTPTVHTLTNAANVMNVTLQSTLGLLETNGASTTQFKSGTTTVRVQ